MRRTMLVLLALAAAACGGAEPEVPAGVEQSVVDRIEALEDCGELQAEFDQALENAEAQPGSDAADVALYYGELAEERLDEVGCYDS